MSLLLSEYNLPQNVLKYVANLFQLCFCWLSYSGEHLFRFAELLDFAELLVLFVYYVGVPSVSLQKITNPLTDKSFYNEKLLFTS